MRNNEHKAWLAALNPGDEVAVSCSGWSNSHYAARIVRRTPTGKIVIEQKDGGIETFNRSGERRLDTWNIRSIVPLTAEIRETWERDRLCSAIRAAKWHDLPTPTLRAVAAVILLAREPIPAATAPEPSAATPTTSSEPETLP